MRHLSVPILALVLFSCTDNTRHMTTFIVKNNSDRNATVELGTIGDTRYCDYVSPTQIGAGNTIEIVYSWTPGELYSISGEMNDLVVSVNVRISDTAGSTCSVWFRKDENGKKHSLDFFTTYLGNSYSPANKLESLVLEKIPDTNEKERISGLFDLYYNEYRLKNFTYPLTLETFLKANSENDLIAKSIFEKYGIQTRYYYLFFDHFVNDRYLFE